MPETTADHAELAQHLGAAWALITNQHPDDAVKAFDRILADHPTLLDGLYGMGLALSLNHQYPEAIHSYEQCKEMAQRELKLHPGSDRYLMLDRLCTQRIRDIRLVSTGQ